METIIHIPLWHRGYDADGKSDAASEQGHKGPEAGFSYYRPIPAHKAVILGWLRHHQLYSRERLYSAIVLVAKLK